MKRCLVFSFAAFLLTASSIQARILHVPSEYSTIQAGIDSSVSGDTVLVSDGIYLEHLDFLGKGIHVMTENGPLATVINLDTAGVPMVTFANGEDSMSILEGFSLAGDGSYWGIYCSGSSPTIYGNIIHAHEVGILAENGRPIVRKNEIISCAHLDLAPSNGGGIRLSRISGVLIDSNTIWYNSASGWGGAIFIELCDSIKIERNIIYSNTASNVSAIGIDASHAISLENNLVLQNHHSDGSQALAAIYAFNGGDLIVENNIIAYNDQYGIGGTSDILIDYNAFFANTHGNINNVIPGPHNIYEDPLFVDYAGFDFRIRGNSPCINAGDPESSPDPDGTRRDIGAFYAERGYIAGTVRDESNQPIGGVYVTTTDTSEFEITGMDGEYILALPGNYEYDVFFTHPDYQEILVEDISVSPADTASLDVNLTYSPIALGEIEGIVVDSAGEPISDVNVVADYSGISDVTDTLGYFRLSGLRPRSYTLFFTHNDYVNLEVPGVIVEGGEITTLPPTVMYSPAPYQRIYVPEDFTSIQEAINNCNSGDTILVAPGTYYESLVFSYSNPVTVMARGDRDETILHSLGGTRIAKFSMNIDTTTVLKGFTIIGDTLSDGIYTTASARPLIYGNIIKNWRCGIRTSLGSAVIRKNEIFECRSHYPVWGSAIRLSNAAQTVIDSNYIHDNFNENGPTIDLYTCGPGTVFEHNIICSNQALFGSAICVGEYCPLLIIANNTIEGNICTNSLHGAIVVGWNSYAHMTSNIIAFNTGRGIYVSNAAVDIIYDDFYENSSGDIYGASEGIGCIHLDPLFANRAGRDFRLMGASPCVDSGDPAIPNDPGTVRCPISAPSTRRILRITGSSKDQSKIRIHNRSKTL